VVFVVEKQFLSGDVILVSFVFLLLVDLMFLNRDLILVDLEELFGDPPIIPSIDANIVDIILIPHAIK